MLLTTLCYIEQDGKYLMLYRNKKENDINEGKWIGVGGRFEEGETPEECMIREVKEETGLTVEGFSYRGLVTFIQEGGIIEYMHLYTVDKFSGEIMECDEVLQQSVEISEDMQELIHHFDVVSFFLVSCILSHQIK